MLKTILKSIIVSAVILSCAVLVFKFREGNLERAAIKESLSHSDHEYKISGVNKWWMSNDDLSTRRETDYSYKLLYEMNFNCSVCLMELNEINKLFKELSCIHEIDFYLVTTENSPGYIKYYLEKELKNYNLWVIYKKINLSNLKLVLLDKSDRMIVAGDIIKFPFLKNVFKRQLLKREYDGESKSAKIK